MVYLQLLGVHAASRAASALQDDHLEAEAAQLPGSCKTCTSLVLNCAARQSLQGNPLNAAHHPVLPQCIVCAAHAAISWHVQAC